MRRRKTLRERIQIVRRIKSQSIQVSGGHRLNSSIKLVPNTVKFDHTAKEIFDRKYSGNLIHRFIRSKQTIARFEDIEEIIIGMKTERFAKLKELIEQKEHREIPENACLSISFRTSIKTIDLVAPNFIVRDKWKRNLDNLIKLGEHKNLEENFNKFLREQFQKADTDKSGSLSFEEILNLLDKLNISFEKEEAKTLFVKANFRKNQNVTLEESLEIDEFIKFYSLLSYSKVLEKHFRRLARNRNYMEPKELLNFIKKIQKSDNVTEADCIDLITKFEPLEVGKQHKIKSTNKHILTSKGFRNILASQQFHILSSQWSQVNQDMTRPLVEYFISTSHNTYLYDDQIEGESTTETFRLYLIQGCRSVELDVTDGDAETDFEPVVTHKNSFTSKTKLSSFVATIREFAFKKSPYPIIISFENNFKELENQRKAATIFRDGFGDLLICGPLEENEQTWPSPEELHNKIILKGKKLPTSSEKSIEELEKEMNLAKELSDLVWYGQSKHMKTFKETFNWQYNQMTSIEENKSKKYYKRNKEDYQQFTSRYLTKAYPNGLRLLSSNYDPMPHWCAGAQMVALNHQTQTNPMLLNRALFETNGSCGYVLKPEHLRNITYRYPFRRCLLHITILGAINLPEVKGDVIDPYVELRLFGANSYGNRHFKTSIVKNNGFNPEWNSKFRFRIASKCLPLAFIRFRVMHSNLLSSNSLIGQQMVSINSMAEGYRSISLKDSKNSNLELAKLFVKIEKKKI